jgi:hypothetical protein
MLVRWVGYIVQVSAIFTVSACKPKASQSVAQEQSAGGFAQHVFYRCNVKTVEDGIQVVRQTSAFNNTTRDMSLQSKFSNSPTLQFSELGKVSSDFWSSPAVCQSSLFLKRVELRELFWVLLVESPLQALKTRHAKFCALALQSKPMDVVCGAELRLKASLAI